MCFLKHRYFSAEKFLVLTPPCSLVFKNHISHVINYMSFDLEELKKDHKTSYLAGNLERLMRQEAEVREMLAGDETLHDLAAEELKEIQIEKEAVEKQLQDILDKDKEEEEFP